MIFYSIHFAVFFTVLLFLTHISKSCKQQHIVFLLANMIFYGYWDFRFLFMLMALITVCYYCAIAYQESKKSVFIILSITVCLGLLGVFKYLNFFVDSFCFAFGIEGSHTLQLILPLGISFYLFQALSYVLDVRNERISAERNFIKLAVYLSFFPQITSGPIVKAHDFLPQLDRVHYIKKANVYSGLILFLLGLTKKIVFADRIGIAVNAVYSAPLAYNGISIIWAIIGYSMQIYCDFSGYSDMAIGIARILDFDLGKNFDLPYLSKNPSEFWRRWHISLSSWFRDYVYIPLGGSRVGKVKTYRNLFITMVLSGFWHGANWTFVIWGTFHGIALSTHKVFIDFSKKVKKSSGILGNLFSCALNFIFVSLLWVIFRAANMGQVFEILSGLFRSTGVTYVNVFVVVYFIIIVIINVVSVIKNGGQAFTLNFDLDHFKGQFIVCTWVFLIIMFMYVGDSAFIYAQF
jgi:alginate O-acetyltransferase complex protein AlgI